MTKDESINPLNFKTAAVLLCAGSGSRMRGCVQDKVLYPVNGVPALAYSLRAFRRDDIADCLVVVVRDQAQRAQIAKLFSEEDLPPKRCFFVQGGNERQDSVCNALAALPAGIECVFIHDCARPLIQPAQLKQLKEAALRDGAAVLAHRVVDTIKRVDDPAALECRALEDLDRSTLWAMETPQVFRRDLIAASYAKIKAQNIRVTDDTAAVAAQGHRVTIVENPFPNPKITLPQDIELIEWLIKHNPAN
mgnify:CR=1 FL=1